MFSQRTLVHCDCERTFDVIADVGRYPEFVPGWEEVRLLRTAADSLLVDQRVRLAGVSTWVRSEATLRRPEFIHVRPADPRAKGLQLEWRLAPDSRGSCWVSLVVRGQASSRVLRLALDVMAQRVGRQWLELFAARLAALNGAPDKSQPDI